LGGFHQDSALPEDLASGRQILGSDHDLLRAAHRQAIRRPGAVVRLAVHAADACIPQQGAKELGFCLSNDVDHN